MQGLRHPSGTSPSAIRVYEMPPTVLVGQHLSPPPGVPGGTLGSKSVKQTKVSSLTLLAYVEVIRVKKCILLVLVSASFIFPGTQTLEYQCWQKLQLTFSYVEKNYRGDQSESNHGHDGRRSWPSQLLWKSELLWQCCQPRRPRSHTNADKACCKS